uniref:Fructose-2,6-bisphosphatase n=1 Tax=Manihot esculenta TaxID=3983 RepID=A0A2C9W0Z8_MANES
MGSSQSVQVPQEEEEEEDDDDDNEEEEHLDDDDNVVGTVREIDGHNLVKKVLQQEPEILPCHASASPLSPQLSSLGTPRLCPSIKVWDPYNVLAPPPPLPPPPSYPIFSRSLSSSSSVAGFMDEDRVFTEVFLINHGECDLNWRPDLVGGRCHVAALTPNGKRQARALAEINFAEGQIQSSDALVEMSLGHWEGCPRSEIYTPEVLSLIENFQPDFCAPSGESQRQVEFRMVQFLNRILGLPEKLISDFTLHHQIKSQGFSHDPDPPPLLSQQWDMIHRHRPAFSRKKSGKSRLQYVTTTGNHEGEDEISPKEANDQNALHDLSVRSSTSISSCIGVFTHSIPIKCLLTGLLGCSPVMLQKLCVDDSSVTVLHHSWKTGWQIKRLNDTAHLRLL